MYTWKTLAALLVVAVLALGCEKKETPKKTDDAEATKAEEPKVEEPKPVEDVPAPPEEGTQWVESKAYGVKFKVPEDWKIKKNDDAVSVTSADDTITIVVVGSESTGVFESAMGSISQEVKFKEMKTEKSSVVVINGLAGFHGVGSAVLELESGDQGIQFLGYALKLAGDKGISLMVFAEAEMYEARKEEIEGIAKTIQKS